MSNEAKYHQISTDDLESRSSLTSELTSSPPASRTRLRQSIVTWATSSILLAFYTAIVVLATRRYDENRRHIGTRVVPSLANDYLEYEAKTIPSFEKDMGLQYFSEPSDEIDDNWARLLKWQNMQVPRSYIEDVGRLDEAVELPNGNFYAGTMVFHHLHCLRYIYRAFYPERYPENMTTAYTKMHVGHCLHDLKQAVMCQGDTTLFTMLWVDRHPLPTGNFTSPRECVNWDRLMEWIEPRNVDITANGMLTHPKYGAVYTDRKLNDPSQIIA